MHLHLCTDLRQRQRELFRRRLPGGPLRTNLPASVYHYYYYHYYHYDYYHYC